MTASKKCVNNPSLGQQPQETESMDLEEVSDNTN